MYASSWRLYIGATSNIVKIMTETASLGGEGQNTSRLCEKIFGYPHRQLGAPLHKASAAER